MTLWLLAVALADPPAGEGSRTIRLEKQVAPTYPADAPPGQGAVRCQARVTVGQRGVPEEVVPVDCPEAFHGATRSAVLQWRWSPWKGEPDEAVALVAVDYQSQVEQVRQVAPAPVVGQPAMTLLKPVERVTPTWPPLAPREEVRCRFQVQVGADGRPDQLGVYQGHRCPALFEDEAVRALSGWRWERGPEHGRRVVETHVTLSFEPPSILESGMPMPVLSSGESGPERVVLRRAGAVDPPEGWTGEAFCRAVLTVGPRGRVDDVSVRDCPEVLSDAVVRGLSGWRFAPARTDGRPDAVQVPVGVPLAAE